MNQQLFEALERWIDAKFTLRTLDPNTKGDFEFKMARDYVDSMRSRVIDEIRKSSGDSK